MKLLLTFYIYFCEYLFSKVTIQRIMTHTSFSAPIGAEILQICPNLTNIDIRFERFVKICWISRRRRLLFLLSLNKFIS